jgi:hypothetical protein
MLAAIAIALLVATSQLTVSIARRIRLHMRMATHEHPPRSQSKFLTPGRASRGLFFQHAAWQPPVGPLNDVSSVSLNFLRYYDELNGPLEARYGIEI